MASCLVDKLLAHGVLLKDGLLLLKLFGLLQRFHLLGRIHKSNVAKIGQLDVFCDNFTKMLDIWHVLGILRII